MVLNEPPAGLFCKTEDNEKCHYLNYYRYPESVIPMCAKAYPDVVQMALKKLDEKNGLPLKRPECL